MSMKSVLLLSFLALALALGGFIGTASAQVPPEVDNLTLTPDPAGTNDDLVAHYVYSGTNPEQNSDISWYKDGAYQAAHDNLLTLPSAATATGDYWHFRVRPRDDAANIGIIVTLADPVGVGIPTATNVVLSPDPALSVNNLVLTYVYSGDNPEGATAIDWYKNGAYQAAYDGDMVLLASETTTMDQWHVEVTPADDTAVVGDMVESNTVGVGVPTATNLAIMPLIPTVSSDLVATYTYTGDNPEVVPRTTDAVALVAGSTSIEWYRDGVNVPAYDDTLTVPTAETALGELWHFRVTPRDNAANAGTQETLDPAVEIVLPYTVSDLEFEGEDEDHDPSGDNHAIRGSKIWVTKGELTGNQTGEIGFLQLQDDSGTWFNVTRGDPSTGNHRLYLSKGSFVLGTSRIVTNSDGEFEGSFILPLEVLAAGSANASMYNAHDPGDVDEENPANNGWAYLAPAQFTNANLAASVVANNDHLIGVQKPRIEGDVNMDTDDPYKNKDTIEIKFEMETEQHPVVTTFGSEGVEWLMILPDFSNMDSAFDGQKGNDEWTYNVLSWTPGNDADHGLDDLIRAVVRARNSGKLEIVDGGGGDYEIRHTISRKNSNQSGEKTVRVFAIDLPSTLLMMGFDVEGVIDNIEEFTESITASPLNTARLNILQWTSGTMDTENPTLQNKAANFDFVVVNPFVNPPKASGYDDDGNPVDTVASDEWVYVFNEGDMVSIMVQIDPHDLHEDQLDKIDPDEVFVTGNEGATIDDIDVIGDISDLLDPTKVDLTIDTNNNGIPDVAENKVTTIYAGDTGGDDDFDGADADIDDEDDDITNGFNERYLFTINFVIDDDFKGTSWPSNRPATSEPLKFRFMVEERIDSTVVRSHYSAWREVYDPYFGVWTDVDIADWDRDTSHGGSLEGIYNPVHTESTIPPNDDEFFGNLDGTLDPGCPGSSISHDPTPAKAGVPEWDNGYRILDNWDQTFRLQIDGAKPSVSVFESPMGLKMNVATKHPSEDEPDPNVIRGAAFVPDLTDYVDVDLLPDDYVATELDGTVTPIEVVGVGDFIYEITGNEESLVTLQASFPSDNDVDHVKFMYSDTDTPGSYKPMKGQFDGDFTEGRYDVPGNVTDKGEPGADATKEYHDGLNTNGDDDDDDQADLNDPEVAKALSGGWTDGIDNDADGLVDEDDVDADGNNAEIYYAYRDEDEDGIMDEDEYVVKAIESGGEWTASWTFDPVRIARILNLQTNKAYAIKAVPYDRAGNPLNDSEEAAAPIYVIFRVIDRYVDTASADVTASLYHDGELVTNRIISDNLVYDLKAEKNNPSDVVESVTFQRSTNWTAIADPNEDPIVWEDIIEHSGDNPDASAPFSMGWFFKLVTGGVDESDDGTLAGVLDFAYERGAELHIRAISGRFGQLGRYDVVNGLTIDSQEFAPYDDDITVSGEEDTSGADLTVVIGDAGAPVMIITELGVDDDPSDGALIPVGPGILLKAETESDDISDVYWQSAQVYPNGTIAEWEDIESTIDKTVLTVLPGGGWRAVSKWDTRPPLLAGRYDIRCIGVDKSGQEYKQSAPIAHVVVGTGKKVAFVTKPAHGATASSPPDNIKARIYYDWSSIGLSTPAEVAVEIKKVIFRYRDPDGPDTDWKLADSVSLPSDVQASYAEWTGSWDLYDLLGTYELKAVVSDDKGYETDGIQITVVVSGGADLRTVITNFASDEDNNPRVSMKIARDGSAADISMINRNDCDAQGIRIKLKAAPVPGSETPKKVTFEYKINPLDDPKDPRTDGAWVDGDPSEWTEIDTDGDAAWETNWDIGAGHPLHDLKVATLVYVRARAQKDAVTDKYVDDGNFVPFVGMVFEETIEPVASIAKLFRDNVDLDLKAVDGEYRVTGGVVSVIPNTYDVHDDGNPQQMAPLAKVELFVKFCWRNSRDGDTLRWQKVATDEESPFLLEWDVTEVASGKYELLVVATDQVGNRSANVWCGDLDTTLLTVDREGPIAYVENPDGCGPGDNGRLSTNCEVLVAATSYLGCIDYAHLYYGREAFVEEVERLIDEGTYVIEWQDIDGDGIFNPEIDPYIITGLPENISGGDFQEGGEGAEEWTSIGKIYFDSFSDTYFEDNDIPVSDVFAGNNNDGYFFFDKNGDGLYQAGEAVWQDKPGGNPGRYNYHNRTVKEVILMGGCTLEDETPGTEFEKIPDKIKDYYCLPDGCSVKTRWADLNYETSPGLDEGDFIWVDLNCDEEFNTVSCAVCEPIVYISNTIPWTTIWDLPPTNDTATNFKVQALDKKDCADKAGNWGPEIIGPVRIENIVAAVWKVNGRKVENNYTGADLALPSMGQGKDYKDEYQRVTGDTVEVVVRVWPHPIQGADVQLFYRYDNDLYPGGDDGSLKPDGYVTGSNGKPNDDHPGNSRYDGIDNDFDGSIDEEQRDKDNNNKKWGEVNVWRLASTTGGTTMTAEDAGASDKGPGENWFEVTLIWDVSGFDGEFSYQFLPIVVDAAGYGVDLYADFERSPARFPQSYAYGCGNFAARPYGYKIIIDHQGPYTFTQVVMDTDEYKSDEDTLDSWEPSYSLCPVSMCSGIDPADYTEEEEESIIGCAGYDKLALHTNDSSQSYPNSKKKGNDKYYDDEGEDNGRTYDVQAKVVSIVGGLYYTKTFTDQIGGVEFQLSIDGGPWEHLGYDYDPDYMSTFLNAGGAIKASDVQEITERGIFNRENAAYNTYDVMDWLLYYGVKVNNGGGGEVPASAYAPMISVATFSLDNMDILHSRFGLVNGVNVRFRTIVADIGDVYGGPRNTTGTDPSDTSLYDELVVENRIGDDKNYAKNDENFMRDVNWRLGAPFGIGISGVDDEPYLFVTRHKDLANLEYLSGRGDNTKDVDYSLNNIIPEAAIIQVDETKFGTVSGVDSTKLTEKIDAVVHEEEQILIVATANPDPNGSGTWGSTPDVAGDLYEIRIYARPHPVVADTNPEYYYQANWPLGGRIKANGWMQIGLGDSTPIPDLDPEAGQSDFPNENNYGYTFRVDTGVLVSELALYTGMGDAIKDVRDFELMAMAVDKDCNAEPFMRESGELIIRVLDMVGPSVVVGGLALDTDHYLAIADRLLGDMDIGGGLPAQLMSASLAAPFTDIAKLDLNNFGNAVFPANPHLQVLGAPSTMRRPLAKVSGEWLHLYILSHNYADVESVSVKVYDESNTPTEQNVSYSKDTWKKSTETNPGHEVVAGKVSHTFSLSEQTALLYLPTWTDVDGLNKPRFENVWLRYKAKSNIVEDDRGSGSEVTPPDPYISDKVEMTRRYNRKGENIWEVTMNLEIGKTYFYYFLIDTVGHSWVIPDPKNLMFDEFLSGATLAELNAAVDGWFGETGVNGVYHNIPIISKLWVPGTPGAKAGYGADDEIWTSVVDLDALPDGVYEIRIITTDKIGYTDLVSKTIVLDRTPPAIDPEADIKVDGRIKAGTETTLTAILHDPIGPDINVVDTTAVLFMISRRGNTEEAVSVWRYAISEFPTNLPALPGGFEILEPLLAKWSWLGKIAMDTYPNGFSAKWLTPYTDQNVPWHVRAVGFDDAMNVQVGQPNQVMVILDGSIPKAKVVKATITRAGETKTYNADGMMLYPTDKDVILTAELVENIDGDINGNGIIEPELNENINTGTKSVLFQYSLKKLVDPNDLESPIKWNTIPFTTYSDPVVVPNADGKWEVTWQVDFSQLVNEEYDQYFHVRAVAEDEVGNIDDEDPILGIMILNDITGPQAHIMFVNCVNVLDSHLAVTSRSGPCADCNPDGDPSTVDIDIDAHNVAVVTLEYREKGTTTWIEVDTVAEIPGGLLTIEWNVVKLEEAWYELRVTAYDGDGNMATEPDIVDVLVDHTAPEVSDVKMWADENREDGFQGGEQILPTDGIYRFKDSSGKYYRVKIEAKTDATEQSDGTASVAKVEAKSVIIQYFHRAESVWKDLHPTYGVLSYSAVSDKWSVTLNEDQAEAAFGPVVEENCSLWIRILATDYACNRNSLDEGFELQPDADAPTLVDIFAGGRGWEGGEEPTIVAYAGDVVNVCVKVIEPCSGMNYVKFYMEGSKYNESVTTFPVGHNDSAYLEWQEIGSGELIATNGHEQLWCFEWTTPLNQDGNNFEYKITAKVGDKAGNSSHYKSDITLIKVEKDITPPVPPEVLFVVTHAGRITDEVFDTADADTLPQILDEYNASDYRVRKMLPIDVATDKDNDRANKYEVFDLYNDWSKNGKEYIDSDQHDTSLEIWVRTPELEYGTQPGTVERRQYEDAEAGREGLGDGDGPSYLKVNYGSLGHDPGINRVFIDFAYDPNQDGDPSDISSWIALTKYQEEAGDNSGGTSKYMDPRKVKGGWDGDVLKGQRPLKVTEDVKRIRLRDGDGNSKGYAYYWVMGDDIHDEDNEKGESVWNTEASKDNKDEELDGKLARDGIYFIRTWAQDKSGNGNPKNDAGNRQFGYTMIRVHNQDDIPPAGTYVYKVDGEDKTNEWPPLEGKWHDVQVRTNRNKVGYWYFGNENELDSDSDHEYQDSKKHECESPNNKFFHDIDYVVVEMWDNECSKWVNVTQSSKSYDAHDDWDFGHGTKSKFTVQWNVPIDSTRAGDGDTQIRAYSVDNGGRYDASYPDGYKKVHEQGKDDAKRNKEADRGDGKKKPIMVDNPRAQMVIPTTGTIIERGDVVQVQGIPVSPGGDPAGNGHDVGQISFLVRRIAAPNGGGNGNWMYIDAKDTDRDGEFGEPGDPVEAADTNSPYFVWWRVPENLVIDDRKTEHVRETTADYWVVALAGDSNTGPLDKNMPDMDKSDYEGWDGIDNDGDGVIDEADEGTINEDNLSLLIDCGALRASIVTIMDEHPPRTRVLQVGEYAVPSEVKIVVGKTVTVFAGDSEVLANPMEPLLDPVDGIYSVSLEQPSYDPDNEWDKSLEQEWRPDDRITLRYAGPYTVDAVAPALPAAGESWDDTDWDAAESDAIHLDDGGDPGKPDWRVYNWVTGGSVLPDGKYFIAVTATDDIGHTTGMTYGSADPVIPDVVEIWIDNEGPSVTLISAELQPDGGMDEITNGQMERGRPLVLYIDPTMAVEDLDKTTFMYKNKHDYTWRVIQIDMGAAAILTQPYSVVLSPLGDWDAISESPQNIVLGAIYQFKAVAEDHIGNKSDSNIIELTVVDKEAEAAIALIKRLDGFNNDEVYLLPRMINVPRLTGRVELRGFTDADVVSTTFLYRPSGSDTWIEIEAIMNIQNWGSDGIDNNDDGEIDEPGEGSPWETAGWLNDGIDNDGDGEIDEPGECGYHYWGSQEWVVIWDTTILSEGLYEIAVAANTGENRSNVSDILTIVIDHNAYDITDLITDSKPKSGDAVGGWTRRPTLSENPRLDPDDKSDCCDRGEVDVYIAFDAGLPADLDMGVSTGVIRDDNGQGDDDDCDGCEEQVDEFDENLMPEGSALMNPSDPSVSFDWKYSAYPDVGDETIHDKTLPGVPESHKYWHRVQSPVVYDAASRRFSVVWRTVENEILNGYYDVRVRIVDEAGNIAYKTIAERVIVDNTPPEAMITSIDDDTSLTYENMAMATDTEIARGEEVIVRATVRDALTSVDYVQFQVKASTMQSGRPLAGNADEINLLALGLTEWFDVGLATKEADVPDSYSLHWNTTGLLEGDYLLRVGVLDILGNKDFSGAVKVTVIDTVPPVATIVGYYPEQLQFLYLTWPQRCEYRFDNIYAATDCEDVQEVQIQYRGAADASWITIGVSTLIPFEQLESPEDKVDDIRDIFWKGLYPPAVAMDDAITEAFNWDGLWGTTWEPDNMADGVYYLRAVAKDWHGNVDPDVAPVLEVSINNGVVYPFTPDAGVSIEFTANLGGTGVGDVAYGSQSYNNTPTVVLTVEAPEKPIVLVLVEVDSPEGLVYGGELVDVKEEQGVSGRYTAALMGDELVVWVANHWEQFGNYLELLRLGGRITVFAATSAGVATTTLTMDDLTVFPVTPELGTNGTVSSKDGAVKVMIPRAALYEEPGEGNVRHRAGLMITRTITPNTDREQRLIVEPVGQAYSIELFDYLENMYIGFRPGFEPTITINYSDFDIPPADVALGFVSVRYWQPFLGMGGEWQNSDIINLSVDEVARTVTFNLRSFGVRVADDLIIPHHIFSIVLEKSLGRIDNVVFDNAFVYPAEPDLSYMTEFDSKVFFRIVDPGGIDSSMIRVYVDGGLVANGFEAGRLEFVNTEAEGNEVYMFSPGNDFENLTEGVHVLRIEAWDTSDAVDESNWQMLETSVLFFIDRTPPLVVTHTAQRNGIRYFNSVEGAVAAITIVDEGVGMSAAELQRSIWVDVFKHLVEGENTPMRAIDQGNIINFQRKTLVATSRPILEYADDYTPDGIDNETWTGIHDNASDVRHEAWRASYTIYSGQIADGDTYEVVFYAEKPQPTVTDNHNENAIYLYEDLTRAVLMTMENIASEVSGAFYMDLDYLDDFYEAGLLAITASDPFTGYYDSTFLVDLLGNNGSEPDGDGYDSSQPDAYFTRHLVADQSGPVVTLEVPDELTSESLSALVSASAVDDVSGIDIVTLFIDGAPVDEKTGPAVSISVNYDLSGAADGTEIVVVAEDAAGNQTTVRKVLGVQEMDGPEISGQTPEGPGVDDAAPTIAAAYSDESGIDEDSVSLTLNGAVMANLTVTASAVSYTPANSLEAGVNYTVKVSVADDAGNVSEIEWSFALETDSPIISDTTPTEVDDTGRPIISAKFSDDGVGVDLDSVGLSVDGEAVDAEVTEGSVSHRSASIMESGTHTAMLTVADVAGNVAEHSWEFIIEGSAPNITALAPSGTINDDMPVLSASYEDSGTGIDVNSVALSLNGEVVQADVTASQASFGVQQPLRPGVTYTVSVTVADEAGNVASESRTFQLETTAPRISGMKPTGTEQSIDVAISANYSDSGSGVDQTTALMRVDGETVSATPSASGISYLATGLSKGTHTVSVEVSDQFGNSAIETWTFRVEETPPVIASVEPSGEVDTATPGLTATYSDTGSGVDTGSVSLSLNGVVLPATINETSASFQVLTPLQIGVTYKVMVEVADRAGNVASDSSTFTLESTPPTITVESPKGTVPEDEAASGIMISVKLEDDGSGVDPDSVMVYLDGELVDATATTESVQYMATGLAYGDHTLRVVAADMLGNTADATSKFSVADTTPPTVVVISPREDAVVGVRPIIKISYADEGSGVDLMSISVKVDDQPVTATAMAPAKSSAKVVSAGEASYEVKLGYGSHTLTVEVSDVAGNKAEPVVVNFVVEGDVLTLVDPHNYPNPVRGGGTKITFGLSQSANVTIRIYDFTATLVATVKDEENVQAGEAVEINWDGTTDMGGDRLANGVYFCQILVQTNSETKSAIVKIAIVREE